MSKKTIIIGISGASGSGKSLLAHTIVSELGSAQVAIISEDSYYKDHSNLPFEERAKINYDHPNAFDHALLHQHLGALHKGETVHIPSYNHNLHLRNKETHEMGQHTIIILEGILLFVDSALRDLMDIRIFVDTPLDICLLRRIKRDIKERDRTLDSVLKQYEDTVRPMYLQFIEPSKRYADVIIPKGGSNRIAIDIIKAQIREVLMSS